jgi:tRNA A37 threonylcarbamoyladenosine dehydratase
MNTEYPFDRLELLVGADCLNTLRGTNIILFGVGGVGSWCAEGLIRSGIGRLTIVDPDDVRPSNINRQLPAVSTAVGRPKVEVLGERLREINPEAEVTALRKTYGWEVRDEFDLGGYDYVIDAIDSLSSKVELIINARAAGVTLFSALGAACKVDATRVRVGSIWKTDRCKLGRFVRKRLRKRGFTGDFMCVWSDEGVFAGSSNINTETNKTVNGSLVCVTGVFGFVLSGLVVNSVIGKKAP